MIALTVTGVAGTVVVVVGVLLALRCPLHAVLVELCLLEHRARFWERAFQIELVAGIALAATLGALETSAHANLVGRVASVMRWELAGAIAGVVVVALAIALWPARAAVSAR